MAAALERAAAAQALLTNAARLFVGVSFGAAAGVDMMDRRQNKTVLGLLKRDHLLRRRVNYASLGYSGAVLGRR